MRIGLARAHALPAEGRAESSFRPLFSLPFDEEIVPNVKVGENAQDFKLNDQDGNPVSLSDFRGKSNVVLFFYPKDFSPGCTTQACSFRDSYESFTDMDAVVIGVSGDGARPPTSYTRLLTRR